MIPKNTLIAIKKQLHNQIYGKVCDVLTEDLSVVRIVRKSKQMKDELILQATNKEHYDDRTIDQNKF